MNPVMDLRETAVARGRTKRTFNGRIFISCRKMFNKFPSNPEHVRNKWKVPEEGYIFAMMPILHPWEKCGIYAARCAISRICRWILCANELRRLLNGILSHNSQQSASFADLVLVSGHQALDFFIRTGSRVFKGRAMMVKNHLYLMAMEVEVATYDETHFNTFVNSFQLKN